MPLGPTVFAGAVVLLTGVIDAAVLAVAAVQQDEAWLLMMGLIILSVTVAGWERWFEMFGQWRRSRKAED